MRDAKMNVHSVRQIKHTSNRLGVLGLDHLLINGRLKEVEDRVRDGFVGHFGVGG